MQNIAMCSRMRADAPMPMIVLAFKLTSVSAISTCRRGPAHTAAPANIGTPRSGYRRRRADEACSWCDVRRSDRWLALMLVGSGLLKPARGSVVLL